MAATSEARKRQQEKAAALFVEPEWSPSEVCCDQHGRVLVAARKVWPGSDLGEAVALADALEDVGLL